MVLILNRPFFIDSGRFQKKLMPAFSAFVGVVTNKYLHTYIVGHKTNNDRERITIQIKNPLSAGKIPC